MKEYAALEGRWCIGTDSHIGIDPLEELRMIDYRQRLLLNKRNTFEGDGARYMISEAVLRGRLAMGRNPTDYFEEGQPLDAVVYDMQSPRLATTDEHDLLPVLVYHGRTSILGTMVNGQWVVKDRRHVRGDEIGMKYRNAMKVVLS
jgi:formimidoylglutamate deiminase